MRLFLVLCLLVSPVFLCFAEYVPPTEEEWTILTAQFQILETYYKINELGRTEREKDYSERSTALKLREERSSQKEIDLNEKESDLKLKEIWLAGQEAALTVLERSSEKSKKEISSLQRDKIIFGILAGIGAVGAASGWTAFGLK